MYVCTSIGLVWFLRKSLDVIKRSNYYWPEALPEALPKSRPYTVRTSVGMNTGLVWYSNDRKLSNRRMVCYSNDI